MQTLFKAILITSPIFALIFFYVVMQQGKIDTEIKKQDAIFERDWAEFQAEFKTTDKSKYTERTRKEEEKITEYEKKEREKEEKAENFEKEFEKAIQEFEKEKRR
ncbi:MAG: hypothetical protein ABIN05_07900 [candidate division WOR-3 bacterium]